MNETLYVNLLRNLSLIAGIVGILAGLDLILGARIMSISKRALEKSYDLDRIMNNSKVRLSLGIAFLVFSLIILLLLKRI